MKKSKQYKNWVFETEPNDDREGQQVWIYAPDGSGASLACAEGEGETSNGTPIPQHVIDACNAWIEAEGINY